MRRTSPPAVGVALVLLMASCGDDAPAPGPRGGGGAAQAAPSPEDIQFGSALAQTRGHLVVAQDLYAEGDRDGAAAHAGHPLEETWHLVGHELAEHDDALAGELEDALEDVAAAVEDRAPATVLDTAVEHVVHLSGGAAEAVVGEAASASAYRGSVIAALLDTAAHEYEEAVSGDRVRLLVEYQDAYGFVREAASLYEDVVGDVEAASAEEADEIEEAFDTLNEALPSAAGPRRVVAVADVEAAAELIGHELEETVGAAPLEESDPAEVVEEIEELLSEIEDAYAEGDAEEAAELSAEAYLENYEVIEAEVIELAPEVNDELEPLLGAELRRQIQAGAPQEEIEAMTERARELLRDALDALEAAH